MKIRAFIILIYLIFLKIFLIINKATLRLGEYHRSR